MMDEKSKGEFTEKACLKVMGKVLDMCRISGMSDRSFGQLERNLKQEFNALIRVLYEELFGMSRPDKKQEGQK